MTYEIYRYIFIGGAILAGIMLAISVLLFIALNIPHVIGDLTGANARKAIEDIRIHNEKNGEKTYRSSRVNLERGKLTDKISHSGRIIKNPSHSLHGAMETERIGQDTVFNGNQTDVLTDELSSASVQTTLLFETTILEQETTILAENSSDAFIVEYEITYIHTDEIIG